MEKLICPCIQNAHPRSYVFLALPRRSHPVSRQMAMATREWFSRTGDTVEAQKQIRRFLSTVIRGVYIRLS
jgi:hypothetical protein